MDPRRGLVRVFVVLLLVAGCQSPAASPPAAAPAAAPTASTSAPALSTAVRAAPSASASPTSPSAAAPSRSTAAPSPSPAPPTAAPQPTAPPATASRVDTLNAANAAFQAGNLQAAAGLYDRVVNTPPASAESAAATSAITDFALLRGMITLLADGREDDARTAHDALQQRDPNAPLARLGDQLYTQYGMVGQLRGACAELQPQVAPQAGPVLAALQALGVTNVDATTLCTAPQR